MAKPLHERLRGLLPDKVREKIPEKWQPPAWRAPVYAPSPWAGEDLEWNPGDPAEVPLGAYALGDAKGREIEHYIPPGTKGKVVAVAEGFVVFSDGQAGYQLLKSDVRSLVPKKERKWAAAGGEHKFPRLSESARSALEIYIFDPVHAEFGDVFPGRLEGSTLYVTKGQEDRAADLLDAASNSAYDDKDTKLVNALVTLYTKVRRAPRTAETRKADLLPGGQGDDMPDDAFDEVELEMGIEDELEHTSDPDVAKEIAKDHLVGDPSYYSKMSASSWGPFKITTEEERDTIRVLTWGELGNKGNYLAWSVDFDGADLPGLDVYAASLFGRRLNRRDVFFLFDLSPPPLGDDASQTWAQRSENHRRWKEETVGPWLDEVNQVVQAAVETWLRANIKHDAAVDMTAGPDPSYYSKMGQYESVVYHGSREPDIEALEGGMPPYAGGIGAGVYVAFDPEVAAFYGPYVYELRLHVPPGEILWLTPDTIDYSLGELLPNSILVGEQVLPFSFHIGDQKYSVVADEREALEAIAAREMRNALREAGGEWEAFREHFEASSRWLDVDDAYEYLADGFAEQGFDVETAEAKAHEMAEWYRGLETQVLANAEKQLGLAIDLSEIGGEAAAAGYRAVYLEGVRAGGSVDSELLVFDPADLEMLGQTRTAAGLGAEQAIDELARGDVGLRRQLEEAARRLFAVGWEGDEPEFRGALARERDKAKFVRSIGLDDATKTKPESWRGVELVGETERYFVLKILDHEGARAVGTKAWCIVRDAGVWAGYAEEGITFFFYVDKQLGPPAALALAVHPSGNTELYDSQDKLMPCFLGAAETEPVAKTMEGEGAETFRTLQEAQRRIADPQTSTDEVVRALSDFEGAIDPRRILVAAVSRADFEQIWDKLGFVKGAQGKLIPVLKAIRHQFPVLQKIIPESFGTVLDVDVIDVEFGDDLDGGHVDVDVFFTSGVEVDAGAWISLRDGEVRLQAYAPSQWGRIDGLMAPDRDAADWETFVELVQDASTQPQVEEAVRDALAELELKNTALRNSVERKWRIPETDAELVDWVRDQRVTDLREWTASELLDVFEELGHAAKRRSPGDWLDYVVVRGDWSDRYYFGAEDAGAEATDGPFASEEDATAKANEVLLGLVESTLRDAIKLQTNLDDVENWLEAGADAQTAASWKTQLDRDETGVLRDYLDGLDALEWQALPLATYLHIDAKTADDIVDILRARLEGAERPRRGAIEVTAAGLPAVGDAAKKFAAEVKQGIDQVRGAEYELRPGLFPDKESIEKMLHDVSDVVVSGRGRVPLTSYLDLDLVRSEEARARLKRIGTFVVVDGRTNHGGWFSPSAQLIGINVSPHELTYNSSWQIWQRIKTTFEHEVRHAIDWAYNPDAFVAANPGEESTGTAPKTRRWWTRYLNQPTELMAWAGNIAAALAIRPSSWERLKWSLDDYKVWVEKEGSVRVLDLVKEENKKRLLQMILKAYDQANPPGEKGPNKWQIMKSDLLAKRKIPESFVASLLPFVYGVQKREGMASEPTWQEWVKNRSTDQIVMEAENNYAVYKILRALPKNALDEYPPLAPMIDDWRQKHGLPYTMRPETADAWSTWERAS